ncbi:MAG: glycosyltransferase family 4 protein [Chitinophagales bacterium]|nr:glycosyltransferase family 4 protein [Chitinophagales bacterium]
MSIKKKILYCYYGQSVFGIRDIELLSEAYDVSACHYNLHSNRIIKALNFIRYNLCVIFRIFFVKAVIINFGAWHTIVPVFMAKLLGKKSLVIVNGFDAMSIPALEYGIFYQDNLLQKLIRWAYRNATYICPVSQSLVYSENKYADPEKKGYKTGLLYFMPELSDKITIVSRPVNWEFWQLDTNKKRSGILAFAYIYQHQNFKRKGFDLVLACARELPEYPFTFAGFSPEMITYYQKEMPDNVTLLSFQNKEETRKLYQDHQVYMFPSIAEGLGHSLLEAMLCGCTPIGSRVGEIPSIIDDDQFILDEMDTKQMSEIIAQAMELKPASYIWRHKALKYLDNQPMLDLFENLIGR